MRAFWILSMDLILLIAWIVFTRKKESFFNLLVSFASVLALVSAGSFTYLKYEDYRKENNYQKVIVRYLDNTIDVSNANMSRYVMGVAATLSLYCDDKLNMDDLTRRKELYAAYVKDAQNLTASLVGLSVFDTAVHLSYVNVFMTTKSVLRLILDENVSRRFVEIQMNLIEPFYEFITYNLQDIGELIRRDTKAYDSPNIESIKSTAEFKTIIERIKKFNNLFDSGNSFNDDKKRENLLMFVSDYLNTRGVPTKVVDVASLEKNKAV